MQYFALFYVYIVANRQRYNLIKNNNKMKQTILLTALISLFAFTSCNNDDPKPGTYPDKAAYATISVVESLEDSDEEVYYFTTDDGEKLFLTENKLPTKYEFENLKRVAVYYTVIEDYSKEGSEALAGAAYDCDRGIRLFGIRGVFTSESVDVTTEDESAEYPDHILSHVYRNIGYSNNYINLLAGFQADDIDDVKFYLVNNTFETPKETKEDYLNLELRYDRGSDEELGYTYEEYVSLNIEEYKTLLEGKKGVLLRLKTKESGTIFVKIDIDLEEQDAQTLRATTLKL